MVWGTCRCGVDPNSVPPGAALSAWRRGLQAGPWPAPVAGQPPAHPSLLSSACLAAEETAQAQLGRSLRLWLDLQNSLNALVDSTSGEASALLLWWCPTTPSPGTVTTAPCCRARYQPDMPHVSSVKPQHRTHAESGAPGGCRRLLAGCTHLLPATLASRHTHFPPRPRPMQPKTLTA